MLMTIDHIVTRPPFSHLFPVDARVLDALIEDMAVHGYDQSKPIDIWRGTVVDGHTRLRAAAQIGDIERVPVFEHDFSSDEEALEYAIRNQRNRRNLTDADIIRCVAALDERKREGRPAKTTSGDVVSGRSSVHTATLLGTSPAKVERTRTVIDHAPPETMTAIERGEQTINGAYRETQERRRYEADVPVVAQAVTQTFVQVAAAPAATPYYSVEQWEALTDDARAQLIHDAPLTKDAKFNRTNDNVEWALWTWNPVTGCLHNCDYCYARDIANRFYPQLFVPSFLPERLHAPRHMKVPKAAADNIGEKNVFTCSMADLFGKWVPQAWIDAVFDEAKRATDWNFLFLTKFPQRLAELEWPANAWCGTTVDRQYRVEIAEKAFRDVKAGVKWLSCEPLLERLTFSSLEMFDWVVIGGQSRSSQTPEFQPPWEWVEHLMAQARAAGCQVYIKPNLTSRPREYPGVRS